MCPEVPGTLCLEASVVPWVGSGLFRLLENPGRIYPCHPEESCLEISGYGNTTCSTGYTGLRCGYCSPNYFRSSGKCVKCLDRSLRYVIVVFSLLFLLVIIAKISQQENNVPTSLRMLLFWIQFISFYPTLSNSWPSALSSFLNFTRIFNLDIGYFGVECDAGPNSYYSTSTATILLPLLFLTCLILEKSMLLVVKKRPILYWGAVSHTLYVSNFLSLQLMGTMFEAFDCTSAGDGTWVLRQNPSILCYSDIWKRFIVFDILAIVFYIFLLPCALI
jgi:hypothetical protein